MIHNITHIRGVKEAPKGQRSQSDTILLTVEQANQWRIPGFQRPVKVNAKVLEIAEEMRKRQCEIVGVITLGQLKEDPVLYLVDGQHRIEAFRQSGMAEVIVDIRIVHFDTMAEMAEEYVRLNTAINRMKPDDLLRGLLATTASIRKVKNECGFVGFDHIGYKGGPYVLSMSVAFRTWFCSNGDTPISNPHGVSIPRITQEIDDDELRNMITFLNLAFAAWSRDVGNRRLWSGLNMTVSAWMYRKLVLERPSGVKRHLIMSNAQFRQCLMSVSATETYLEWLPGRTMGDRDRSPCYGRLKAIFTRRLQQDSDNKRILLPQPAWAG